MPAPANTNILINLIRKSGMVEESRLDNYLEMLRTSGGLPHDPRKLAGAMVTDGLLTYFQAEQFLLGKSRGFTIGNYKLLERIGIGGMGQVFLCEHMQMRRQVAIKVLPPVKAEDPASLGRFYREARAAAALNHLNIVRTHDIDQDGKLHFLIMEYVDGTSLLDIVKKTGPMNIQRATNYIWQTAQGLDHAYQVGIIHRDIKPGNIMVDRGGVSKILDMGLARFHQVDDDMLTLKYDEKSVLGTADYVAPEQVVNSHEVDIRADLYSLGATFYFLLAGHPPFPAGTIAEKLMSHRNVEPTPIRQIRPEVPEGLAAVLSKMLAKSIEVRYQNPDEVYDALMPYVDAELPAPPEEEMPTLSLAARDQTMASGGSGRVVGAFRQDSAPKPTSGRLSPTAVATPNTTGPDGPDGSDSSVRNPFEDIPATPNRVAPAPRDRPTDDTKRMNSQTERTPMSERKSDRPPPAEAPPVKGILANPIVRILLEAIAVFGLALLIWWIYSKLS